MDTTSSTLARFLHESPIALSLASPGFDDNPLVLVNEAFTRLTGYAAEDAVGRNCRFLQGPATEAEARAELRTAIVDSREAVVPITNYRRDGSRFRNLVFIFPIFDQTGRLLYVLGSQYDVTAPRRAVSPKEYGQMLDDVITMGNPVLASRDQLQIKSSIKLADVVAEVLESR